MRVQHLLFFLLLQIGINAQVKIGEIADDNSAALQVSDFSNKGVLIPRVEITDITNKQKPIANPADGMIVYNHGHVIAEGVYIWFNNKWNQLADTNNIVGFLLLQRTTDYPMSLPANTFVNLSNADLQIFHNDFGAIYDDATGIITLPGKSGYIINMCLNIRTTAETATSGVASTPVNAHNYQVKLINPNTGTQYGETINFNAISSGSVSTAKSHIVNVSFSFYTRGTTPLEIIPSIAHGTNGTYTGDIIIENIKIDVQRAMLVK